MANMIYIGDPAYTQVIEYLDGEHIDFSLELIEYVSVCACGKEREGWPGLPPMSVSGITQADEWVVGKNKEGAAIRLQI